MSEHLPECWAQHESDPPAWCICDELRACEARVTVLATPETVSQATYWYEQGQRDALAAAVQRVEELREKYTPGYSAYENLSVAIAAIKGDQSTEDKMTFIRGNDRLEQLRRSNS